MTSIHRRTFLFQSSAAVGLAMAARPLRAKSANEKLNLGFIGTGGRGNDLLKQFSTLNDVRIAALCDPDREHLENTAKKHRRAAKYSDLRKLLDDKNVDAVVIATC